MLLNQGPALLLTFNTCVVPVEHYLQIVFIRMQSWMLAGWSDVRRSCRLSEFTSRHPNRVLIPLFSYHRQKPSVFLLFSPFLLFNQHISKYFIVMSLFCLDLFLLSQFPLLIPSYPILVTPLQFNPIHSIPSRLHFNWIISDTFRQCPQFPIVILHGKKHMWPRTFVTVPVYGTTTGKIKRPL